MAKRPICSFTFVGHPTTAPNTPNDSQRINLSKWITAILVRDGDEQPGQYRTPGADGYTDEQLADAPARYAHLLTEKPQVADAEIQLQVLALMEAGLSRTSIVEELEISESRLTTLLQAPEFRAEYGAAKALGHGKRVNSSAVQDSAKAQRSQPPTQPTVAMQKNRDVQAIKDEALEKLRQGVKANEVVIKTKGMGYNKAAEWRKDHDFRAQWDEAKAAGALVRESSPPAEKPTKAAPVKTPRETIVPDSTMALLADSPPTEGIKSSITNGHLRELEDAHSQANDDYMRHVGKCMGLREAAETVQKTAGERFVQGKDKSAIALRNIANLLATLLKGYESLRDEALQVAVQAGNELSAAKAKS